MMARTQGRIEQDMATYRIWCRTQELGPRQFLVTVTAFLSASGEQGEAITSESRLLTSLELARAEALRLVESMKTRLVVQGHRVAGIDEV